MTPMRVACLLVGLVAPALAGCALKGSAGSEVPSGAAATPPVDHPAATPPAPEAKPKAALRIPPPPPPPPRRRPLPPVDAKTLVGLTQDETRLLIGAPGEIGDQAPAQVWSYSSSECGLDIYFYLDLQSRQFKALTYEVKGKANRPLSDSACLDSLRGEGG